MHQPKIKIQHRLLTKLQLSHLIVVVLPIALAAWLLVNAAQSSIEKTIQDRNLEITRRAAQLLKTTLDHAQAIVRITAQNPLIYESNRITQELTLNNLVKRFRIFKEVSLVDSSGTVSLSTSYLLETRDFSASHFLTNVMQGQSYYSDVYLGEDKHPVMEIAEPIRYRNTVIGILLVEVDLSAIWELVESSKIGEKGQAFILDRNGLFLAHSERKRVYLKESFDQNDILLDINQGISDQKLYRNSAGVIMLSSYAPLTIQEDSLAVDNAKNDFSPLKLEFGAWDLKPTPTSQSRISLRNLGLGVVIQQPISEAFAVARKMRYQMIFFAFISIMLALILASFSTQRILSPISKLISGIERFSTGNLDYEIESLGKDEIGMLSERFNDMAVRLLEYQKELKRTERLELMNKMSSVLSHEIRNPLNSMVINMQLMRREFHREGINREKLEKYHQIVASEIRRVDELVSNFLLMSRPQKLDKQRIALNELLNEVIIQQQAHSLHKGIRVERIFETKNLYAKVDAARLRQALLNIYLNGIQAMKGGGKFTVRLAAQNSVSKSRRSRPNRMALIQFIDTGNGIPPDKMKRIFDFYYSTKESGTGLGLSIAQQIIEEHNGKLTVESIINAGSTFSIFLPLD